MPDYDDLHHAELPALNEGISQVQALQSVQIQTPLFGFAFCVGLKTSVELAARGSWSLGVNVVPLVMLCLLLRADRHTKVAPLEPALNSSLHGETEP
jgi:hypothetical protein